MADKAKSNRLRIVGPPQLEPCTPCRNPACTSCQCRLHTVPLLPFQDDIFDKCGIENNLQPSVADYPGLNLKLWPRRCHDDRVSSHCGAVEPLEALALKQSLADGAAPRDRKIPPASPAEMCLTAQRFFWNLDFSGRGRSWRGG
jgi:hypothetical protein